MSKLVIVDWDDSSFMGFGWMNRESFDEPHALPCRTVGWLTYDGENSKVVVPHISSGKEGKWKDGCGAGGMTIPVCSIRRIQVLTTPDMNGDEVLYDDSRDDSSP